MKIGIVGKPNVGKSTFFSAITAAQVDIAAFPFTTVAPNVGVGYVRIPCPHIEFGKDCHPGNSKCINGNRFVPVQMVDVAGLVRDAHTGRGLGNKFLDDLRQADALIHIIDISGATDAEGNPVDPGTHNPEDDIAFLENEIILWIKGILEGSWKKIARQIDLESKNRVEALNSQLTGLGIKVSADLLLGLPEKLIGWSDENLIEFSRRVVAKQKPMLIAGNKADIAPENNINNLSQKGISPILADYELVLNRAASKGMIEYLPGDNDFKVIGEEKLNPAQKKALNTIKEKLNKHNGTGLQKILNKIVFDVLGMIVVYPVEDEGKLTNKDGHVLPDAFLVKKGTTAKEFAFKIHSEIGEGFIRAIDAKTKRVIGADHELKDGDIIKIVSRC